MKHEFEYDYADIEAYIRQANQLRSQALGQMLSAAWAALKQSATRLAARCSTHAAGSKAHHGLVA